MEVAYCSMQGAEAGVDPGFGMEVTWDVPLLDGYSWRAVPNRAWRPGLKTFFGLVNTGLWKMIRRGHYDGVAIYTGYRCATFWIVFVAAKLTGTPFFFATDVSRLDSLVRSPWKGWAKRRFLPAVFRSADGVLTASTISRELVRSLGIPDERITLTPNSVDNDWWRAESRKADRAAVRAGWGISPDAPVALFCGKLAEWKRPLDALRAIAKPCLSELFLVFAGDGPLRKEIERQAASLGVADRVRLLGFVNQSALPAVYSASDVLVLPSDYDAFGLVINEAMICGCPAVISDRVGARYDLLREAETGYTYPCGDVDALAERLRQIFSDRQNLKRMSEAARRRLEMWSPKEYAAAWVGAMQGAQANHSGGTT
jgi:glycosyltransferase involved in cell wall biosynthesis